MSNLPIENGDSEMPEIGGFFGLDLPLYRSIHPDSITYQSGRAAIRAVIEAAKFDKVLLPAYVCNSVINAVEDSGATVEMYFLDADLYPKVKTHAISDRSALLYVNYFGLCDKNVSRLTREFPTDRLIIDNSQALFATHSGLLGTVYSPRKFVGVPDGGLLYVSPHLDIELPKKEDSASMERMRALMLRMAYSAREGYEDFQKIATSLKDTAPLRMSRLTMRLLQSVPWDQIKERRKENYLIIDERLAKYSKRRWHLDENAVPMCYPFTPANHVARHMRTELSARNIFVPQLWLDASSRIEPDTVEYTMTHDTLFLPIDQRLDRNQMEYVANVIVELINRYG
jgi:hypothetical protein